jgi:hypothetical protein
MMRSIVHQTNLTNLLRRKCGLISFSFLSFVFAVELEITESPDSLFAPFLRLEPHRTAINRSVASPFCLVWAASLLLLLLLLFRFC